MAGRIGGNGGVESEPNVTPLIDVVLVLLIIFMVVTPKLDGRFQVAIPEKEAQAEPPPPADANTAIVVHLGEDGAITVNGEAIAAEALVGKIRPAIRRREDKVVFFEADEKANYGRAVAIMDLCRAAGASHVGIVDVGVE